MKKSLRRLPEARDVDACISEFFSVFSVEKCIVLNEHQVNSSISYQCYQPTLFFFIIGHMLSFLQFHIE